MSSAAYSDYVNRLREAISVLRLGLATSDPVTASGCAKSATVLAAAALERFINDAIRIACQQLNVATWDELAQGQQSHIAAQMATKLKIVADGCLPESTPSKRYSLRKALEQCLKGLENPSTWPQQADFGMFMEGVQEPERINGILRSFDTRGRNLFSEIEKHGKDRAALAAGLTQLIDARHSAAHALQSSNPPSPKDAQVWIVQTFWLAREIDDYLGS
jgi:hypothetical protein